MSRQRTARRSIGRLTTLTLSALFVAACGGGGGGSPPPPAPPPPPPPPPPPAPAFVDATQASNISYRVGITNPAPIEVPELLVAESTFGGVAAGDCDSDGDIDLFVTYGDDQAGSGPGGPNRLYLNQLVEQGDGLLFADSADAAGVANTRTDGAGNDRHSGPVFVDLDGDGHLDLFVGGLHGDPNKIYRNRGNCIFDDVTVSSGIAAMQAPQTVAAAFGDYDLDGDLDMLLAHWGTRDEVYPDPTDPGFETEHLWQNVSDPTNPDPLLRIRFVNDSKASGVSDILFTTRAFGAGGAQQDDYTFTPSFARINDDVWPDILLAGDFGTSQVLLNDGDGTFSDLGDSVLRDAQNGMGSALGDIDDDGDLDWFVTSIFNPDAIGGVPVWGNRLFRNDINTGAGFTDVTDSRGVADGEWGWGACFVDLDNDADLDIYHVNGWDLADDRAQNHDFSIDRSRVFVSAGGSFTEAADELGLADAFDARGVVCADFDHDGDIDLLTLTNRRPNSALLWRNVDAAAGNNVLRVELGGLAPNTQAVGARIEVTIGGRRQMREVVIGANFIAQNPVVQLFGLGSATQVDEIRVEWPAVDSGGGLPDQPVTVINDPLDVRLQATAPGETLLLSHP